MLVRLGRLNPDDMTKCRRLFSKLDRDCSGYLNNEDIQDLLASAPDTSFIGDDSFDVNDHQVSKLEPDAKRRSVDFVTGDPNDEVNNPLAAEEDDRMSASSS